MEISVKTTIKNSRRCPKEQEYKPE